MRKKERVAPEQAELTYAIGLVWGHLSARQFEEAYYLAKSCLGIWPEDRALWLMLAFAAAEVLEPFDLKDLERFRDGKSDEWIRLVRRRSERHGRPRAAQGGGERS